MQEFRLEMEHASLLYCCNSSIEAASPVPVRYRCLGVSLSLYSVDKETICS